MAYPDEKVTISGGRKITNWKRTEGKLWTADVKNLGLFRQLFVNDRRATRARTPNDFYHYVDIDAGYGTDPATGKLADLSRRGFHPLDKADARSLAGLTSKELSDVVVQLYFHWNIARLPVTSVDGRTGRIILAADTGRADHKAIVRGMRHHIENYRAALDAPGEWFLARDGVLHYKPRRGEDMATAKVVAPALRELLLFKGDCRSGQYVEHITMRGLRFRHTRYDVPATGYVPQQAAANLLAGTICADSARNITIDSCEIAHTGAYAISVDRGCSDIRIQRCHLYDLGAGGVRIGLNATGKRMPPPALRVNRVVVDNNIIHSGGRIFTHGVGVLIMQAGDNRVTHNDIADFYYTGVNVGWQWVYLPALAHRNRIDFNRIRHLGQGVLSDMGGVYTLGISPGTTVSNNVIYDIREYEYGGWGLYNDQSSSNIHMENNLVYDAHSGGYMLNSGKDNIVRNNIFAFAAGPAMQTGLAQGEKLSVTFESNIVCVTGGEAMTGRWDRDTYVLRRNLYWDVSGKPVSFLGKSLAQWQAAGKDAGSTVADPLFVDASERDFRLSDGSPAGRIGFVPFDPTRAGVYGDKAWIAKARSLKVPAYRPPPAAPALPPLTIDEGFETTPLGKPPAHTVTNTGDGAGSIGVTDELASTGRRCLKVVDGPGLSRPWQPLIVYNPDHRTGTVKCSFDIRPDPGADVRFTMQDRSRPSNFIHGPGVTFTEGKLCDGNYKQLMNIPMGKWIHIELSTALGKAANGKWTLSVTVPDQPPRVFTGLPHARTGFNKLTWMAFLSNAEHKTSYYLDNLKLSNSRQ